MPGLTNRRRAIQEGSDWTKGYSEGGSVKKYVKGGSVSEKEMEIWKGAAPSIKKRDIAIRKAILKKIGETKGSVSEKEIALLKQATLKPAKKARKRSAKK